MKMDYINKIRKNTICSWANKKYGEITCYKKKDSKMPLYRFVEINPSTMQYIHSIFEHEIKSPVIADGLVAFWISSNPNASILEIFQKYAKLCFESYKNIHQSDIELWNKDLERHYFTNYHLSEEKRNIQISNNLLEYIGKDEAEQIRLLENKYKCYIRRRVFILWKRRIIQPIKACVSILNILKFK